MSTESQCPHCGTEKMASTARCQKCGQDAFEPALFESISYSQAQSVSKGFNSSQDEVGNPIKAFFNFLRTLFFHPEKVFENFKLKKYKISLLITYSLIISWVVAGFESMFFRSMGERMQSFFMDQLSNDEVIGPFKDWFSQGRQETLQELFSSWHMYVGRALLDPFFTLFKFAFLGGLYWIFSLLLTPAALRKQVDYSKVVGIIAIAECAKVFQLIPFLGWLIAVLAIVYLQILGLRSVFSLSTFRATMVLMMPPLLGLGAAMFILMFFAVGAFALFSSFFTH